MSLREIITLATHQNGSLIVDNMQQASSFIVIFDYVKIV